MTHLAYFLPCSIYRFYSELSRSTLIDQRHVSTLFKTLTDLLSTQSKHQIQAKLLSVQYDNLEAERDKKSRQLVEATKQISQLEQRDLQYQSQLDNLQETLNQKQKKYIQMENLVNASISLKKQQQSHKQIQADLFAIQTVNLKQQELHKFRDEIKAQQLEVQRLRTNRQRDSDRYERLVADYDSMNMMVTELAKEALKKAKDLERGKKKSADCTRQVEQHIQKVKGAMLTQISRKANLETQVEHLQQQITEVHEFYAQETSNKESTSAQKTVLLEQNFERYKDDLNVQFSKKYADLVESSNLLLKENEALKKHMQKLTEQSDGQITLQLPATLAEISQQQSTLRAIQEYNAESSFDYTRFIQHGYMLEVRKMADLDSSVNGIFGDESVVKDFVQRFESSKVDGQIKMLVLAILQQFLQAKQE